jgi:hypothetical protein
MDSSTANEITKPGNQNFFLSPQFPLQRQYEALRAYLVDEEPSGDVARRFGYSPGFFRVLCYQFRHDPQKRASFFRQPQRGPQSSPARDRVRDLAVAMRKRNLSVYDMQRELAAAGHTISVNSLTVLLREEGFSRLPRRADDERPVTVKPEVADVADVRRLDLSPCSFRTPLAGLFLFLPLLDRIDLQAVVTAARLPSSQMIPAAQAVRSLLALKLIGAERKSHVMDLVADRAIALFAGINVVPKRSYLAAYSSRIDHKVCLRFMEAWLEQVEQAGLPHGSSFDLDFHSVPANSAQEPLEKHYVSSRSRSQKGILVFLARDAQQRVLRYADAGVSKGEQADEILQFVRFWTKHTGQPPAELVFDSQLTTYQKLSELNREGISFITLRRRSDKMLREIYRQPDSAWQRISLPALTRIYRNPRVLENRVTLPGYGTGTRGTDRPADQPSQTWPGRISDALRAAHAHRKRDLRGGAVLPYRRALQHGRDESGFRYATDARSQFAVPHDGPAHRQRIQPLPGQNRLSQFVGPIRQSGGHSNLGPGDPGQARAQPLSGRLWSRRSAHTHALVRRQEANHSICLSPDLIPQHAIPVTELLRVEIEASLDFHGQ